MSDKPEARRPDRHLMRWRDWFEPAEMSRLFDTLRPFEEAIRVEEEVVGDKLVIRAELPGVDPERDVEITVEDGMLVVRAERRKETSETTDGGYRSEFRYGSFRRALALPKGAAASDVAATYRDGILVVEVPMPKSVGGEAEKVAITRG